MSSETQEFEDALRRFIDGDRPVPVHPDGLRLPGDMFRLPGCDRLYRLTGETVTDPLTGIAKVIAQPAGPA